MRCEEVAICANLVTEDWSANWLCAWRLRGVWLQLRDARRVVFWPLLLSVVRISTSASGTIFVAWKINLYYTICLL